MGAGGEAGPAQPGRGVRAVSLRLQGRVCHLAGTGGAGGAAVRQRGGAGLQHRRCGAEPGPYGPAEADGEIFLRGGQRGRGRGPQRGADSGGHGPAGDVKAGVVPPGAVDFRDDRRGAGRDRVRSAGEAGAGEKMRWFP